MSSEVPGAGREVCSVLLDAQSRRDRWERACRCGCAARVFCPLHAPHAPAGSGFLPCRQSARAFPLAEVMGRTTKK